MRTRALGHQSTADRLVAYRAVRCNGLGVRAIFIGGSKPGELHPMLELCGSGIDRIAEQRLRTPNCRFPAAAT